MTFPGLTQKVECVAIRLVGERAVRRVVSVHVALHKMPSSFCSFDDEAEGARSGSETFTRRTLRSAHALRSSASSLKRLHEFHFLSAPGSNNTQQ